MHDLLMWPRVLWSSSLSTHPSSLLLFVVVNKHLSLTISLLSFHLVTLYLFYRSVFISNDWSALLIRNLGHFISEKTHCGIYVHLAFRYWAAYNDNT